MGAVLFVLVAAMLACLYFGLMRNTQVFRFRQDLNRRCFSAAVEACDDDGWRWDAMNTVTYERMLLMFWRPLRADKWYADTRFLDPIYRPLKGQ